MTTATIKRDGFEFQVGDDGVARVRDVDIAAALGIKNARDLRSAIAAMIADGELPDVCVRRQSRQTQMPTGGVRTTEYDEYWLDKAEAYTVSLTRRTDAAKAFRRRVVAVYIAVEDEWKQRGAELPGPIGKFFRFLLAPKPAEWESCFGAPLVRALSDLYGFDYVDGGRHPRGLQRVNRMIYDAIFSAEVGAEIKRRNPEPRHGSNHSQHLSPEARAYFVAQLDIVEALARGSVDRTDFWARVERQYGKGMLQMPMHLEAKRLSSPPSN